ncbi:DNA polymerase III subunit delta [Effusibacillus lacus]|uniref:DNA polymerase III subunit delta n=1 Tax=Effusibacillus lacus TaxID=1348429 RepID=A0A292YNA9_9BACL|nr:DNA polymerase III subunit delta [Effusibacillus lacus]TCS68758.1 DNA polymerase III delta subunit [Effusibacillus lacus]GAX90676.1 DNA polymerase III subunit delta [Effusibacillus lacus]
MSYREIMQEIKQGVIRPIYVLYGTEQLLIREVVEAIEQAVNPGDSLNTLRFHCDETPVQVAVQEAETLPFLNDRRLVIVQNAVFFTGSKSARNDHDLDMLLRYLENPASTSTLILTVYADKLDERKKITKAAQKSGKVVPFFPLKEQELLDWILARTSRARVAITREAIARLVLTSGSSLSFLSTELNKLSLYAGENGTIDEETVDLLASRTLEQDIFVFVDEVVRLRTEQALRLMEDLIKNKQAPIYLLFMITRQVRIMLQVKIQSVRGLSSQQIAGLIGVHPYACKVAGEQAKRYTKLELETLLMELADIDYKIKTGKTEDRQALEMFLLTMPRKVKSVM